MDENKLFHASRQMDARTREAYRKAVPDSLANAIVKDLRKPPTLPLVGGEFEKKRATPNYVERPGLEPVGGVSGMRHMDAIANEFARRDRIALARELGVALPKEPKDAPKAE